MKYFIETEDYVIQNLVQSEVMLSLDHVCLSNEYHGPSVILYVITIFYNYRTNE